MIITAPRFMRWLGAPAKSGLALPEAKPTASQLYCPRGVFLNDKYLIAVDSGNHRLLIWKLNGSLPENYEDAQIVIGQADFFSEGPKLLHLPTGVTMVQDTMLVADAWHHRILGWHHIPEDGAPPDFIIGQKDLSVTEPNQGGPPGANTLYWPYGLSYIQGKLFVADTGNRRVLFWNGIPQDGRPADGVIGQPDFTSSEENRGGIGPASFRWAHDISGNSRRLLIADAGNHRILGWPSNHLNSEDLAGPAGLLIGQTAFDKTEEYPYRPQSASLLRFPYGISLLSEGADDCQETLAIADTANNRVLIFDQLEDRAIAPEAQRVIGQPDFKGNGENNWKAVTENSLCWPYGLCLHRFTEKGDDSDSGTLRKILAIADSGNNRIMLWEI